MDLNEKNRKMMPWEDIIVKNSGGEKFVAYMIKIKQNLMQEDFLELEPILLKELKQDERLENAYLYGKVQQMSLFD